VSYQLSIPSPLNPLPGPVPAAPNTSARWHVPWLLAGIYGFDMAAYAATPPAGAGPLVGISEATDPAISPAQALPEHTASGLPAGVGSRRPSADMRRFTPPSWMAEDVPEE